MHAPAAAAALAALSLSGDCDTAAVDHPSPAGAATAAALAPAAVTPATALGSAAAAAAAAPTPLEQRQWRRLAQRSLRLAATAFKDATARFVEASSQGTAVATQLTNSVLSERYLPGMQLPAVLQVVQGLKQAAASKLQRQQQQQLEQLVGMQQAMAAAVQDMRTAFAAANSHIFCASSWQSSSPVFHALCLPESVQLLQQILDMYDQELLVKQGLIESFSSAAAAAVGASGQGSSSASSAGSSKAAAGVEDVRRQLTAAITTWMVRPCVEDERVEQLLLVLTDDMVGF